MIAIHIVSQHLSLFLVSGTLVMFTISYNLVTGVPLIVNTPESLPSPPGNGISFHLS